MLAAFFLSGAENVSAQSWVPTTAPRQGWVGIAASADGSTLAAVAYDTAGVFVSTNSGGTWNSNGPAAATWLTVAISADGKRLAAAGYNGNIYTSTNTGTTWTQCALPFNNWVSLALTPDGRRLTAVASFDPMVYSSTNFGDSWVTNGIQTEASSPTRGYFRSIAISADGNRLALATIVGGIFTSTNGGSSWTGTTAPVTNWSCVAGSADGRRLTAADALGGTVYVSNDYGANWFPTASPSNAWYAVASSADGKILTAVAGGQFYAGAVLTSTNAGYSWNATDAPQTNWYFTATSADGGKAAAVIYGGGIYISQSVIAPRLAIQPAGVSAVIAWTIPSTNFMLQQSADLSAWSDVTNPIVVNYSNLQSTVAVPATARKTFYRLRQF